MKPVIVALLLAFFASCSSLRLYTPDSIKKVEKPEDQSYVYLACEYKQQPFGFWQFGIRLGVDGKSEILPLRKGATKKEILIGVKPGSVGLGSVVYGNDDMSTILSESRWGHILQVAPGEVVYIGSLQISKEKDKWVAIISGSNDDLKTFNEKYPALSGKAKLVPFLEGDKKQKVVVGEGSIFQFNAN